MKELERNNNNAPVGERSEPGPGNPVMANLRGIADRAEMDRLETEELRRVTEQFLGETSPERRFTTADIRRMHREWLGGSYPWAGEYRQAPMNRERVRFASPAQIPGLMQELEDMVLQRYTPCTGSPEQVATALAIVHAELVLIHPFPDGNIRVAQLLGTLMGKQAGMPPLDFSIMSGENRENYLDALWAGIGRDYEPITGIFREIVRRSSTLTKE